MEGSISNGVKKQLTKMNSSLAHLEDRMRPVMDVMDSGEEVDALLNAQMYLVVAQTVETLFHSFLIGSGHPTESPSLNKEKERMEQYKRKVSRVESTLYLKTHKPSTQLNIAAANRFITAAIPDLTAEQREALKVGAKRKQDSEAGEAADQFLDGLLGPGLAADGAQGKRQKPA